MARSRGGKSCVVHTPDKGRLMERLSEGNRRAALDVLSEILPKARGDCGPCQRFRSTIWLAFPSFRRAARGDIAPFGQASAPPSEVNCLKYGS